MSRTFIIAEAGVNHNGCLKTALKLVEAATEAGADAIKFQTFDAHNLATPYASKAAYQKQFTDEGESQLEMLQSLQLSEEDFSQIASYCDKCKLEFISSPFDVLAVDILIRCKVQRIKIPSGEITNAPLLLKVASTGLPSILSTGMSKLSEVEVALATLAYGYTNKISEPSHRDFLKQVNRDDFKILKDKVTLLHCTSLYPTSFEDVNLRCIETLKQAFGLSVGYSDHTVGSEVSVAAVALGCQVIEKHFTLDRNQEGPDHQASLEPGELRSLISMVRNVENALGSPFKYPVNRELDTRSVARKGIVAKTAINAGERFDPENLAIKRPESDLSPYQYWTLIGRIASKSYVADESLEGE